MLEINNIYNLDCLYGMQLMKEQGLTADLVITDPPYLIKNTKAGSNSKLSKSIQGMNDEIESNGLTRGITEEHLTCMWELMRIPNIYIWCNGAQIPQYLDFFVKRHKCSFDILIWNKTNATPLFHNKYLTDKEYCLYFRKGGYCMPVSYDAARTVYYQPINIKDKRKYGHPTVKPLNIIMNLVLNSSKEDGVILDPFMGSGTTAEACKRLKRKYIGFETNKTHYEASLNRLASVLAEEWNDKNG